MFKKIIEFFKKFFNRKSKDYRYIEDYFNSEMFNRINRKAKKAYFFIWVNSVIGKNTKKWHVTTNYIECPKNVIFSRLKDIETYAIRYIRENWESSLTHSVNVHVLSYKWENETEKGDWTFQDNKDK